MFLRDYLYVDIDKVNGLVSQINAGVPDRKIDTDSKTRSSQIKLKIAEVGSNNSKGSSTEYSLQDTLFAALESDLESLDFLRDISEELTRPENWNEIDSLVIPGQIVRITAPGNIFHPRQMNESLVNLATTCQGLVDLGHLQLSIGNEKNSHKNNAQKKQDQDSKNKSKNPVNTEDYLPAYEFHPDISRQDFVGMIRIIRGTFADGLHLYQRPQGVEGPMVSCRLEEGRKFLDSSPDVLLSRYGIFDQEWTVVGMIGQIGAKVAEREQPEVTRKDGAINRAGVIDLAGDLMLKSLGLVDIPIFPDFTVIPIAVYRNIIPLNFDSEEE